MLVQLWASSLVWTIARNRSLVAEVPESLLIVEALARAGRLQSALEICFSREVEREGVASGPALSHTQSMSASPSCPVFALHVTDCAPVHACFGLEASSYRASS